MIWNWPNCTVVKEPHDGDTFRANVDMGRGIWWFNGAIRLAGINAPELKDPGGVQARDYLRSLLSVGTLVRLESVGYDKFGDRVDANVFRVSDGLLINGEMVRAGHAVTRRY